MDVLRILFIGLLMGCTRAVETRSQVATPQSVSPDAWANFLQRLDCEPPARLYLVSVHYEYDVALCSCLGTQEGRCSVPLSPSSLGAASSSCWESSDCNVTFRAPPVVCDSVTYSPQSANFTFMCVPATPTLSFNTMDSATGISISVGYSGAPSNDIRVCVVETPDCSMVEVSLELVIRNEDAASSSFFSVPGHLDTLGQMGVSSTQMTLQTPFSVVLHVLSDKQLQNAFMAVQADTNVTMKCGLDTTMPSTTFCNLQILSTSPNRKFGQALTAVYSPTGVELPRDWLCVIEECSVGTPVNVTLYVKNGAGVLDAYFSVNNGLPEADGTRTLHTPASVTLHVFSRVALAYIHAQADTRLSMTCGENATMIPTPACNHCASSPCPEGVVCSNVPDSFVCGCPGGHILSTDGQSCVVLPTTEISEPLPELPESVVGPVVGGTLGALAFIAIVIVIIDVICHARSQKKRKAREKPVHNEDLNNPYEEVNHPYEETVPGISLGQQGFVCNKAGDNWRQDVITQNPTGNTPDPGVEVVEVSQALSLDSSAAEFAEDNGGYLEVIVNPNHYESSAVANNLGMLQPETIRLQIKNKDGHLNTACEEANHPDFVCDNPGDNPRRDVITQNPAASTPGPGVEVVEVSQALPLDSSAAEFAKDNGGYLEVIVNPNHREYGAVTIDPGDLPPIDEKQLSGLQKMDMVKDDESYMEVTISAVSQPNGDLGKDLAEPGVLQPAAIRL